MGPVSFIVHELIYSCEKFKTSVYKPSAILGRDLYWGAGMTSEEIQPYKTYLEEDDYNQKTTIGFISAFFDKSKAESHSWENSSTGQQKVVF